MEEELSRSKKAELLNLEATTKSLQSAKEEAREKQMLEDQAQTQKLH